jgi:hypothetical protein
MTFKLDIDREKVEKKIALISEKIDADVDPRLLNEYRLLFKKGISFFRRSWAAAYLLMLYDQGQGADLGKERGPARRGSRVSLSGEGEKAPGRNEGSARRDGGGGVPAVPQDLVHSPRPFLAEEESRRLFISIGRNRRVFPREILGLIITRARVAREDIGMIRILDSYSFVQVRDTVADTVIEALNGAVFRGRPMTVNYARVKREEGQIGDQEGPVEINGPAEGEAMDALPDTATGTVEDATAETTVETTADNAADLADAPPEESYPDDPGEDPEPEEGYSGGSEQGDDQTDKEGV